MTVSCVPLPGTRALSQSPWGPSSRPPRGRPSSACRLPRLAGVEEHREEEEFLGVVVLEVVVVAAATTGSTRTPACPTCSRPSSRSTWTHCTSERLAWPPPRLLLPPRAPVPVVGTDTRAIHTPTAMPIATPSATPTNTPSHTGSPTATCW